MLSVIVPIYNGAAVLPETVPAMMAQEHPAEWVFVDDGSTDDTAGVLEALLRAHPPPAGSTARMLQHGENRGRAEARETGVGIATHSILLFLDCDVAPEPGYLAAFEEALSRPGVVGGVGQVVVADVNAQDPYHYYLAGPGRGAQTVGCGQPVPWHYFLLGVGGVHRAAYEAVGGLQGAVDYGEDLELGARLGRLYPDGLRYLPGAVGRIYDVGTLSTALARMEAFGRDSVALLADAYPELEPALKLPIIGRSRPLARRVILKAAFASPVAWAVKELIPVVPRSLQRPLIRYLLAQALARGYWHDTSA